MALRCARRLVWAVVGPDGLLIVRWFGFFCLGSGIIPALRVCDRDSLYGFLLFIKFLTLLECKELSTNLKLYTKFILRTGSALITTDISQN